MEERSPSPLITMTVRSGVKSFAPVAKGEGPPVQGVERVPVVMGARNPGGAADARDEEHPVHIHLGVVDAPKIRPLGYAVATSGAERE